MLRLSDIPGDKDHSLQHRSEDEASGSAEGVSLLRKTADLSREKGNRLISG